MDEIKKLSSDEFTNIAARVPFDTFQLVKDYYVTAILYLLKEIDGIYFKGGTALQKIFLDHSRLSEDADFTVTKDMNNVKKEIKEILMKSGLFEKITEDKNLDGFTRLVVHYKSFTGEDGTVFVDLNKRAKLLMKSEKHVVQHFYESFIPVFSIPTMAKKEMVAEKIRAAIQRNKPRDHFDIYMIIRKKIPIDMKMVKKKCEQAGIEFNVISMFNRANKLHKRWDADMVSLLAEEIPFEQVMKTLAQHFKLKEEKDKLKK